MLAGNPRLTLGTFMWAANPTRPQSAQAQIVANAESAVTADSAAERPHKEQELHQGAAQKEAEARRKCVRRVNFEKEDRDALRKLARRRSHGMQSALESTLNQN